MSEPNLEVMVDNLKKQAIADLGLHDWSEQAAKEFVDIIIEAAVLRIAYLQRCALSSGENP